jgi:hypothetical protein
VAEESRTRVCGACGFPAIANMRRCPFCRETFPRMRLPAVQKSRLLDPLSWLALAWIALMIPIALLTLTALSAPLALVVVGLVVAPAAGVWLLRGRMLLRMHRLSRRAGRTRPLIRRVARGDTTGSEQPPSDAMRR